MKRSNGVMEYWSVEYEILSPNTPKENHHADTALEDETQSWRQHPPDRLWPILDPDTGLQPNGGGDAKHVLETEAFAFWNALPQGSVFVFYQHEINKAGKPWIEDKRAQLADAIRIPIEKLGVASSPKIAKEVVLFYASKA